jgi:hypothetical protein
MHLSPAAIEGAIRLLDQGRPICDTVGNILETEGGHPAKASGETNLGGGGGGSRSATILEFSNDFENSKRLIGEIRQKPWVQVQNGYRRLDWFQWARNKAPVCSG